MKPLSMSRKSGLVLLCLVIQFWRLGPAAVGQDPTGRSPGPHKPTNSELLVENGYEATPQGLAKALQSSNPFACIYALKVASERSDPKFLPQASALLKHEFIKVQLEAAKLLAQFDRPDGIAWLQSWEKRVGDDPAISADEAHVVLDAASALALRGDERLARQLCTCLRHESWAVKIHAARALADFHNFAGPELRTTWLTAADVLMDGIRSKPPVPVEFVHLYLRWLVGSAAKQPHAEPRVAARFAELATLEHAETAALRQELSQIWESKVKVNPRKPAKPPRE